MMALATVAAQNVQLHYDMGGAIYGDDMARRPQLTSTVEMFRPDKWGSTFFFVDMDYNSSGVASAYWEIARELKFWKPAVSIHVEYNGGTSNQFSYKNAYLLGLTYTFANKTFTRGASLTASYKYIQEHPSPSNFQLTGTWYLHFGRNGLCTFSGFADWWREKTYYADGTHRNFIFIAEPQFWVNLSKIKGVNSKFKLSIGSELELSNNFGGRKGFYAVPTLALKWSFD